MVVHPILRLNAWDRRDCRWPIDLSLEIQALILTLSSHGIVPNVTYNVTYEDQMFQKAQELAIRALVAVKSLSSKRRGASAIEYGLLAGLIAVVIIVAVGLIGTELNRVFNDIKDALVAVPSP